MESSEDDIVIEMEHLKLDLDHNKNTSKSKHCTINIYVNELIHENHEKFELCENEDEESDDDVEECGDFEERDTPYFIEWQAPIVEWLAPIRDWQASCPSMHFSLNVECIHQRIL